MDQARWSALATKGLKGKSLEDLVPARHDGRSLPLRVDPADPLAAARGLPPRAVALPESGQPWQIQQTLDAPADVLQALEHGIQGVRISESAQQDFGLDALLAGVYLDLVDVHLDGPEATGLLRDLVERQVDARTFTGSCSRDVLRAADGDRLARHVEAWGAAFPRLLTWGCDAAPWIDAGASLDHALSAVVSGWDTGVAALESAGIGFEAAVSCCTVRWAVGTEVLVEAAVLRALRQLWRRWLAHRHAADRPLWIDARTSTRTFVRALPEDNLLRTTASAYAAVLGGADGVEVLPHDFRTPAGLESARRFARNIQHLLIEEASLHAAFDPLQGSRFAEYLTNDAADRAWAQYVQDAARGGWAALWESGAWEERVRNGRTEGLQAPLFLPKDTARGSAPLPEDWKAPLFVADHQP